MANNSYHNGSTDLLVSAILSLKTPEECYAFLDDICTISEIHSLSQRMETALLLDSGMNYVQTAEKAGTSTATICRVNKCLQYGSGGYRTVLDRIGKKDSKEIG